MRKHTNITEICLVINGKGTIKNGTNETENFEPGDRFIFPSDVEHEIINTSSETAEFYFFRLIEK